MGRQANRQKKYTDRETERQAHKLRVRHSYRYRDSETNKHTKNKWTDKRRQTEYRANDTESIKRGSPLGFET